MTVAQLFEPTVAAAVTTVDVDRLTYCIYRDPTSSTTDFVDSAFIAKQSITHRHRARRYS